MSEVVGFLCTGAKACLLVIPCDLPETADLTDLIAAFEEVAAGTVLGSTRFLRLAGRLCVCGKCPGKATGILRSLAMILRGSPSMVVSKGQGISGFMAVKSFEFEEVKKELVNFLDKS
jgi:hypothetical protein